MNKFEQYDVVRGTVTGKFRRGVIVKADGIDADCFCRCGMEIGDIALFTVKWYEETADKLRVFLECDSVLEFAPIAC
ncbi:MAG: hypothetical protein ACI4JF_06525 [Oscillospiraceae bacterium]